MVVVCCFLFAVCGLFPCGVNADDYMPLVVFSLLISTVHILYFCVRQLTLFCIFLVTFMVRMGVDEAGIRGLWEGNEGWMDWTFLLHYTWYCVVLGQYM